MHKRFFALVCAILMLTIPALAANVDYTLYGDAFHPNLPPEDQYVLTYDGVTYSLLDDCARFEEALSIYGGKSRAVYEYTLPQGSFAVEDNGEALSVGRMIIDVPYRAQLTVLEGNRRSGKYAVIESRELTDVFSDEIFLPRNESGVPVLMDRIYLYTYESAGETKHMAATLFFDYEGFTAGYNTHVSVETPAEPINGDSGNSPLVVGIASASCLAIISAILRRRNHSAASKPVSASEEAPASGRDLLEAIRTESLRIGDGEISDRADKIHAIVSQMLAAADEQPDKAPKLRRFLNYYLPTSLKLLASLRTVQQRGVSKSEVDKMRTSALHGLDLVLVACQKQLDNLYRNEMLDMSADIDVLEQMLARDGFTESGLDKVRENFRK